MHGQSNRLYEISNELQSTISRSFQGRCWCYSDVDEKADDKNSEIKIKETTTDTDTTIWNVVPLQHTSHKMFWGDKVSDAFNPFHNYMFRLRDDPTQTNDEKANFPDLPLFHTWPHFFEAYHNHF
jgi:hypothetical protein